MRELMTAAPFVCVLMLIVGVVATADAAGTYGLGRAPDAAHLARLDIAVGPRGDELPKGAGTAAVGAPLYARHCAACHGANGLEGPDPILVGGLGSLTSESPLLTIGSYWPWATTVFDYVRRAMPFHAPGSLSNDELYALTAHLLHLNGIVERDTIVDRRSLPRIEMPNHAGFVADPRPDVAADAVPTPGGEKHDDSIKEASQE